MTNHFLSTDYSIEQLRFADGMLWNAPAINAWLVATGANLPTEGADTLRGGSSDDTLNALGGDDTVSGGAGHDTLSGGTGSDRLFGNTGNDLLYGQADADWLYGNDGNDVLDGGAGLDTLQGGAGDDRMWSMMPAIRPGEWQCRDRYGLEYGVLFPGQCCQRGKSYPHRDDSD